MSYKIKEKKSYLHWNIILIIFTLVLIAQITVGCQPPLDSHETYNEAPVSPPSIPQDFKAIAGYCRVLLIWKPPVDDGGAWLINYLIYKGTSMKNLSVAYVGGPDVRFINDADVIDGQKYYYQLIVSNVGGGSSQSKIVSATPLKPGNNPPKIATEDLTKATENQLYSVDYDALDLDMGNIEYIANKLPKKGNLHSTVWTGKYIYIFGGQSWGTTFDEILCFDPIYESITVLNVTLPTARYWTSAIWNGKYAYIFGGDIGGPGWNPIDEILRFDPVNETITIINATLPTPRWGTASIWDGQMVYIFGGFGRNGGKWESLDDILCFDIVSETIKKVNTSLPLGRQDSSIIWNEKYIYLFGGGNAGYGALITDEIIRFDPMSKNVTILETHLDMGWANSQPIWDGKYAYFFGGYNNSYLDEIVRFDPVTETVHTLNIKLPTIRAYTSAIWNGTYAYIFGGTTQRNGRVMISDDILKFKPGDTSSNNAFSWALNTNASWLSINVITGLLSGTPPTDSAGTYWVNVSISDEDGMSDYHNFTLTVIKTITPVEYEVINNICMKTNDSINTFAELLLFRKTPESEYIIPYEMFGNFIIIAISIVFAAIFHKGKKLGIN
jgi:N-acetylneuraminic acid mutarotase